MLYGYRESVDNRIATIVAAADTMSEYDEWVGSLMAKLPFEYFVELAASKLIDHLFRNELKGYKRPVLIVYHDDDARRDLFIQTWNIAIVKGQVARDRQKDMVWLKEQEDKATREMAEDADAKGEGREITGRTLEEIHNLVGNDPWDRRTPEQIAHDAEIRKQMKDAQKRGDISGDDSFGNAAEQRAANTASKDTAHVTDIRHKENADGTFDIDNILARKFGGEVDDALGQANKQRSAEDANQRKAGKRVFSPEDFAAVLAGDGSADHLNMPPDPSADKLRREPGSRELVLSPEAQEARRAYQEQQRIIAEAAAAKRRAQDDVVAIAEHQQGIFKGADLFPDQSINTEDLPQSIRDALVKVGITGDKFPLKEYPYNSQIGDFVLLPQDGILAANPIRISKLDNIEELGNVSMDEPAVTVARKVDSALPGWIVYSQKKKDLQVSVTDNAMVWNIYIVKVR